MHISYDIFNKNYFDFMKMGDIIVNIKINGALFACAWFSLTGIISASDQVKKNINREMGSLKLSDVYNDNVAVSQRTDLWKCCIKDKIIHKVIESAILNQYFTIDFFDKYFLVGDRDIDDTLIINKIINYFSYKYDIAKAIENKFNNYEKEVIPSTMSVMPILPSSCYSKSTKTEIYTYLTSKFGQILMLPLSQFVEIDPVLSQAINDFGVQYFSLTSVYHKPLTILNKHIQKQTKKSLKVKREV
jgi:hypothetical protein